MGYLKELGIVTKDNKSSGIFETILPNIFDFEYQTPAEFIKYCWTNYEENYESNPNINGRVFEYSLACVLIIESLVPFALQAKVAFIPNVDYDLLLYEKELGPIVLSAKTSLRERYKQADLEALALKNVHRRSESYLITLDKKEGESAKKKLNKGDLIGLNDVIIATDSTFDEFIERLKQHTYIESPIVKAVTSTLEVTSTKVNQLNRKR